MTRIVVEKGPLHDRLAQAGANFGESAGWERVQWFGEPGSQPATHATFGKDDWFRASGAGHAAARSGVTLFDQTSFTHLLVQGCDALALLQRLSTNDVDVPIGRIVYTPWLNERGGMESDVTICRTGEEEFLVVTAAVQRIRDLAWLKDHARAAGHVAVADVSSGYVTLSVMGPRSRELLSRVSPADFSPAFPFAIAREIEIGYGIALAFPMTFVGELRWELHLPAEQALGIYDAIVAAGYDLDLRLAGYVALNTLRLEAGYRDWGSDVGDEDTPWNPVLVLPSPGTSNRISSVAPRLNYNAGRRHGDVSSTWPFLGTPLSCSVRNRCGATALWSATCVPPALVTP